MAVTVKDMMEEANAVVEPIDTNGARALLEQGALLLDVRDTVELQQSGLASGAHHIPRSMLEFRADSALKSHDPELRKERPVILYCASGGRSALAGKLLRDMGYQEVYNLGGFSDWVNGGGETEPL